MLGVEESRPAFPFFVSMRPIDPFDRSNIFYSAAENLGFELASRETLNAEGIAVRQITAPTLEQVSVLQSLEKSFVHTPIGTLIEVIGIGQYPILMASQPRFVFPTDLGRLISHVPPDVRQTAFMNAYIRDGEMKMDSASGFTRPEFIRANAMHKYRDLRSQGEVPYDLEELEDMALDQLTEVINLLRVNPFA